MNNQSEGQKPDFTGPLFIVGMPRSGTKLLRDLLLGHPKISIQYVETRFLPYWIHQWDQFGDLSDYSKFSKFYNTMLNFPYFISMRKEKKLIQMDVWFNTCKEYTPSGVFEALIRHDTNIDFDSHNIWGDKSPSYIDHILLIKEIYPSARFIHIIRDVRDYCLSINKAWGKNMIRAAQKWTDSVSKIREDSSACPSDYLEIKYEDLLECPADNLKNICDFLNLDFKQNMTELSKPAEDIGDTIGKKNIVQSNKNKYLSKMKPAMRAKIEAISISVLKSCDYTVEYTGRPTRVPGILMTLYRLQDAINLIKDRMKEDNLLNAIKFHFKHFIESRK